ncbi:MAG: hypothetical protein E6X17_07825 [Sporomusaceae bacterium]|nr:hypothetical protein [Sporomusaceae bacterium]
MKKLQLLEMIQKLSAIVHSEELNRYNLTPASIAEMRNALDTMTEEYIAAYC